MERIQRKLSKHLRKRRRKQRRKRKQKNHKEILCEVCGFNEEEYTNPKYCSKIFWHRMSQDGTVFY